MLGLDDYLASLSNGGSIVVVLLVATLLGLRHATDPDHIAAITTLVASGQEQARRRAAALGAWWGFGHAVTLVVFGVPILLFEAYLPENVQRGAETAVAALIVYLAVRLLVRHRHRHEHGRHQVRSPLAAFGIGLVHGLGGSAGVGVLLLAAIPSTGARGRVARRARALHRSLDDGRDHGLRGHSGARGRKRSELPRRCSGSPVSPSASGTPPPRGASSPIRSRVTVAG